ncbi:MAG TPA: hypothetical protein VM869_13525 [Enhygromyxa sp.]|nr:hypothetical protein [Enhygromyxa sp.]
MTDVQRRTLALYLLLATLAAIGAWRWWLAPRQVAAAERERGESVELRRATIATLAELGIPAQLDERAATAEQLAWRAPGECIEVYRMRVDERHRDESVAVFIGREEEHASYYFALARASARARAEQADPVIGVLTVEGEAPRVRELWWGAEQVGPSAPDFACRRRSWDPFEDALALGWPRLPAARTWVGARWRGATVGGRCHETPCLDPDGSFGHALPCRARPWAEQLIGAGEDLALILGEWDDGHDPARPELGVFTSRELVLDHNRPLYVRAVIEQRWAGVRRELSLVRLDDCSARSLATPGDRIRVEETRAELEQAIRARLGRATH